MCYLLCNTMRDDARHLLLVKQNANLEHNRAHEVGISVLKLVSLSLSLFECIEIVSSSAQLPSQE